MSNNQRKKIMIINWKWTWFHDHKMTDTYLKDNPVYLKKIHRGRGRFFDHYSISDESIGADSMPIIVATTIYSFPSTLQILFALIDYYYNKYKDQDPQMFLLLHRGNFYDKDVVFKILNEKPEVEKCFLFAHGRDYIYYKTQKKGLLDEGGGFFKLRDEMNNKVIEETYKKVNGRKVIDSVYFNNVWNYYDTEFKKKIFSLKQDFFECLSLLFTGDKTAVSSEEFYAGLKNSERKILLRMKSFLGSYDQVDTTEKVNINITEPEDDFILWDDGPEKELETQLESDELEKFEKEQHQSFSFDDCNANLEHIQKNNPDDKRASELYQQLVEKLRPIINDEQDFISKNDCLTIRSRFQDLIDVLPSPVI